MTNEEMTIKIQQLEKELNDLKALFYKDNYSNLEVFRKKVEFKAGLTIADIDDLVKTGGTAVIADGDTVVTIPVGGGSITISTKNGIITNIT